MVRAIFFDIDGTLISLDTHLVPDSTQNALYALREKGIKLFVATGRARQTATYLREVFDFEFDGYITVNGQCCTVNDEIIYSHPIPSEEIVKLLPYIEKHKIACSFIESDKLYLNLENDYIKKFYSIIGDNSILGELMEPSRALENNIYQLGLFAPKECEEDFCKTMTGCKCLRWHPIFADVIPKDGGKHIGMDKILEYFNIPLDECAAFGDGENDVDMIKHAGIGIAMGNASDFVKSSADFITKSVDDDGVLHALKALNIL